MIPLAKRILDALADRALSLDTLRYELDVSMLQLAPAVKALRDDGRIRPEGGRLVRCRGGEEHDDELQAKRPATEPSAAPRQRVIEALVEADIAAVSPAPPPITMTIHGGAIQRDPIVNRNSPEPAASPGGSTMPKSKTCEQCKVPKPLEGFPRANRSHDGRAKICTDCKQGTSTPAAQPRIEVTTTPARSSSPPDQARLMVTEIENGVRIGRLEVSAAGLVCVPHFIELTNEQLDEIVRLRQSRATA